jgi:hypothetical protein
MRSPLQIAHSILMILIIPLGQRIIDFPCRMVYWSYHITSCSQMSERNPQLCCFYFTISLALGWNIWLKIWSLIDQCWSSLFLDNIVGSISLDQTCVHGHCELDSTVFLPSNHFIMLWSSLTGRVCALNLPPLVSWFESKDPYWIKLGQSQRRQFKHISINPRAIYSGTSSIKICFLIHEISHLSA